MQLIEVAIPLLLPTGRTRLLRALIDSGATDNFIHKDLTAEFNLTVIPLDGNSTIAMGTADAEAVATGETQPLSFQATSLCQHKTKFTILNLGDYDIILGWPFQRYTKAVIQALKETTVFSLPAVAVRLCHGGLTPQNSLLHSFASPIQTC